MTGSWVDANEKVPFYMDKRNGNLQSTRIKQLDVLGREITYINSLSNVIFEYFWFCDKCDMG